jgi:hypothetical protein
MHMVILVLKMTMMPTQPSMIESWSYHDLRCNVHAAERERAIAAENDRPGFSPIERGRRSPMGWSRKLTSSGWTRVIIGSASVIAGGMWMLSILGFEVPWFSVLPMALMFAGSFIIAASLNHRSISEMISHDRCNH